MREVRELARLGCRYVQLDAPHYPLLVDPVWRAYYEARGWPADEWIARGIELDNAVIAAAPEVTFGFHLCRGNQGSRWLVSGGYEPDRAGRLRWRSARSACLLEYDDERSGGFAPLELVSDDAVVVLGLVTTKTPRRETVDDLSARIHEAARIVPLERLAIGTQCGFATSIVGNAVSPADQRRKLEVIAETAEAVWG